MSRNKIDAGIDWKLGNWTDLSKQKNYSVHQSTYVAGPSKDQRVYSDHTSRNWKAPVRSCFYSRFLPQTDSGTGGNSCQALRQAKPTGNTSLGTLWSQTHSMHTLWQTIFNTTPNNKLNYKKLHCNFKYVLNQKNVYNSQ